MKNIAIKKLIFLIFISALSFPVSAKTNTNKSLYLSENKIVSSKLKSLKVQLHPLITHTGTPGAGCFIHDSKERIYSQFLGNDEIFLNLNNKEDEKFSKIDDKLLPKGYTYGYKKANTLIYIKKTTRKKPEGCLTYLNFKVLIRKNKKDYYQKLIGFCGC